MNSSTTLYNLGELTRLGSTDGPLQRLHPAAKLFTTILFIVVVMSFGRYTLSALLPFLLYPVVLATVGNIPPASILRKVALALPFALCIGIFNPFLDTNPVLYIGTLPISGGILSFCSILFRLFLTVSATLALIGITGFYTLCAFLPRMGVPRIFANQLLFLYRYLFVLLEEASRMERARNLRTFSKKGLGLRVYAQLLGHLLLRTFDRAERIHQAMLCRAYTGSLPLAPLPPFGIRDLLFCLAWGLFFLLARVYDLPQLLGHILSFWI